MTYSRSRNFTPELRAQLAQLLPEAFQDGQLNLDILRQLMGEEDITDNSKEHFELTWVGKRDARKLATAQPVGALIPAQGEGINEDTTQHIFIEGENLETLRLLRQAYTNKIKMIYIDPPYNTGNDFIYKDDFSQTTREYLDTTGENLVSNPRSQGRFHANWLSFIYPRLRLAKDLLREDGVIFVSIDDNEVHNLRQVMDEIFGAENLISEIVVQSNKRGQTYKDIAKTHEYIVVYSKTDEYTLFELEKADDALPFQDSNGFFDLWELRNRNPKFGKHNRPNLFYPIYVAPSLTDENGYAKISLEKNDLFSEQTLPLNAEGLESCWRWGKEKVSTTDLTSQSPILIAKRTKEGKWNVYEKSRKSTTKAKSLWNEISVISEQGTVELGNIGLSKVFDHPKPIDLVKKAIRISTESTGIILDFFAGSGTTAQAVLELNKEDGGNRQFICVQIPEKTDEKSEAYKAGYKTIAEITKERIRRVIAKLQKEQAAEVEKAKTDLFANQEESSANAALDLGFKVYKLQTTNIRQWQATEPQITPTQQELEFHAKNPFTDLATNQGILAELQLNEGFPLHSQAYRAPEFTTNEVWRISSDYVPYTLFVCLDNLLNPNTLKKIKQVVKDSDVWICKDTAFGKENDSAKVLLAESCQLKTL